MKSYSELRIGLASDHAGYALKEKIADYLRQRGADEEHGDGRRH